MDKAGAASTPSCRLTCLLARESSKAVIFRRGPSRHTCLIAWDRESDSFEVGQWFKGSVYPERSALSPDGEWLLVFMGNFRGPLMTWTVLSRPPWFTAVALWPKGDTWGGGGVFLDGRDIVLRHGAASPEPSLGRVPNRFTVKASTPALEARIGEALAKDPAAWRSLGRDWRGPHRRRDRDASLTLAWETTRRPWVSKAVYDLALPRASLRLPATDWAEFDRNGDLLFAQGGALYRLARAEFAELGEAADIVPAARLLADFTALRFQAMRAPYAAETRRGTPGSTDADAGTNTHTADEADDGYAVPLDQVSKEDRRQRRRERQGGRDR